MARRRKRKKAKPSAASRIRIPGISLFRMFVLGLVSIIAAMYALVRHVTREPDPMLVPVPPATELPAPELVPIDGE